MRRSEVDVQFSKFLSYVLRHGAQKEGLQMTPDGYILVDDILAHRNARGRSVVDVRRVVDSNDKQRFSLSEKQGRLYIKANQGHSIEVQQLSLKPVTDLSLYPIVVHGTYYDPLPLILRDGLNRMSRTHIHFAVGLPGDEQVISGMRSSAQVLVYIDLRRAIQAGVPFFVSENNVLLSPGVAGGYLPAIYFQDVVDARTRRRVNGFVPAVAAAAAAATAADNNASKP